MSKKTTKKTENIQDEALKNTASNTNFENSILNDFFGISEDISKNRDYDSIKTLSLTELMALENACALLCKRFETTARLDSTNNTKFKEYQIYYEKIFSELESRVNKICNAV